MPPLAPTVLRQCSACFTSAKLGALESSSQPAMLAPPSSAGCSCGAASAWPAWTAASLAALYPTQTWDLGRADGSRCTLPALVEAARKCDAPAGGSHASSTDADVVDDPSAEPAQYSATSMDEPLYVFDADFADAAPALAAAYAAAVPAGFPAEDGHLAHLTTSRALRRPWRWRAS